MSLSDTLRSIKDRARELQGKAYDQVRPYAILDDKGETYFFQAEDLWEAAKQYIVEHGRSGEVEVESGHAGTIYCMRVYAPGLRIIVCQAHHLRDLSNSKRRK